MMHRWITNSRPVAFLNGIALVGVIFFLALANGGAASPAQAQNARPSAGVQKDYDEFIARFRVALKANDAAGVTALTRFPYPWDEMRDAAYFRRNVYGKVFTAKARRCLARGKGVYDRTPNGEDNFTLICGEEFFLFTRTPDGFRFAENNMSGG